MAFGFGFNKQKVLSAAEKFVQQGKLQNAIAEYDKILKHDPNDLTVNNTIGDLYARLGDANKAIESFKKVGDAYAAQGFTVKGIAMYKKITKLQPSVDGSLKLAELYTQQGLFNDARAQYLQVAEDFMKNGDLEQAVRLFQKVLEMDPENVPMRVKLAEVYVRLGKKKEAWEIFSAAAESLRARGSLAAAEDVLKRMLVLDPGNGYVLLLRGKAALESDDPKAAIGYLEKAPDLDSHPEGLRDLLKAYLQVGALPKAGPVAEKLLTVHNDPEGLFLLAEGSTRLGQYHEALDIYTRHADRLLGTDSTKLLASLHSMITHVRDDSGALDTVLQLLNKAGESTHVNEVTELLAHACVKEGNLARARDLYQMLATTEPQNQLHTQNYQQVVARMEQASPSIGITAEEGAVIVEELEATAPVIDQSYPDHVAISVRSAVTDADLFLSYNLPDKAVVPLLGALPQAPRDARLNQRLAALHTRFHRFTEAAVCCRTLESVYSDAGFPDEAVRYGELAARYEQNADAAASVSAAAASSAASAKKSASSKAVPVATKPAVRAAAATSPSAPWPKAAAPESHQESAAAAPPEFVVEHFSNQEVASIASEDISTFESAPTEVVSHQLPGLELHTQTSAAPEMATHEAAGAHDVSSEWEDSLSVDEAPESISVANAAAHTEIHVDAVHETGDDASNPEIAETVEEVQFYLEHFMTDQARAGIEKLEALTSNSSILDPLRAAVASVGQPPAEAEPEIAEIVVDNVADNNADIDSDEPVAFELDVDPADAVELTTSPDLISSYNDSQAEEIPIEAAAGFEPDGAFAESQAAEVEPAQLEPAHALPLQPEEVHAAPSELDSIVADLESSLGDSFPQAAPLPPTPATAPPIQTLPGWPTAPKPKRVAPAAPAKMPAPEAEPVVNIEIDIPAAPAAMPAAAASAGGAAAATAPAMSYSPAPIRPLGAGAQAAHASDSVDLSEMFGELKQELEEDVAAGDEDPETHYNLGVAFREMGLLDEAIAELQKVCVSIDRGIAFSQPVQTYTWLAQCFMDKGVPEAAIRWYEKALEIPGLDAEARVAINYELGSACEAAGDKPTALKHFTQVYGANIDYRDVAERIKALKS
jgi:tetratricopeptide (TPR) repeat protein